METSGFLDQLLRSARGLFGDARARAGELSAHVEKEGIGGMRMGKLGQGMVAGSLLTLLLGSRGGRRLAKLGGVALLGTLAWRAWQERQPAADGTAANDAPPALDRLPPAEAEAHSRALLVAMIAAARADGHIDQRELELIRGELDRADVGGDLRAWLQTELERPLDPARVAQAATSPQLASEMYLASLLVVDVQNARERQYLDDLAHHLGLDPQIRASLERQIG